MKRKIIFTMLTFLIGWSICLTSCTENSRARNFGGKQEFALKPNEMLINVTWKDDDMWVLTKDTITNVQYFRESSSFGIWEGEIVIKNNIK